MSRLLAFDKLHNTRDLGGLKTTDGHTIRSGLLLRSGRLSDLTSGDVKILSGIIRTVIDLRSDGERAQQPDIQIPGVENIHIPIVDSFTAGISREKEADQNLLQKLVLKPEEAKAYMCRLYRAFTADFAVGQYKRFLNLLLESDGPFLWHCTAGKDRAGIASIIVEEILDVERQDIIDDYLKTNEYVEKDILFFTDFAKKQTGTGSVLSDEAVRYLFGAEEEYITAFYDAVNEKYGNMESFIRKGLGVDKKLLKEKYVRSSEPKS